MSIPPAPPGYSFIEPAGENGVLFRGVLMGRFIGDVFRMERHTEHVWRGKYPTAKSARNGCDAAWGLPWPVVYYVKHRQMLVTRSSTATTVTKIFDLDRKRVYRLPIERWFEDGIRRRVKSLFGFPDGIWMFVRFNSFLVSNFEESIRYDPWA